MRADVERGIPIDTKVDLVTFHEAAEDMLNDCRRQVDRRVGEVRLDPGTTKNREGRVLDLIPELPNS